MAYPKQWPVPMVYILPVFYFFFYPFGKLIIFGNRWLSCATSARRSCYFAFNRIPSGESFERNRRYTCTDMCTEMNTFLLPTTWINNNNNNPRHRYKISRVCLAAKDLSFDKFVFPFPIRTTYSVCLLYSNRFRAGSSARTAFSLARKKCHTLTSA